MKKFLKRIYILTIMVLTVGMSKITVAEASENMDMLEQVNAIRAEQGRCELTLDSALQRAAYTRAREAAQVWSHTRPNGQEWYTVDPSVVRGENLAKATAQDRDKVVEMWMESAAHRDNILFSEFTTTGIAAYYDEDSDTLYVCQLFGGY